MNSDEQAIRTLVKRWLDATREGNVEEVLTLMAPDAIFLTAGQPPMQGHVAFADTLRSILRDHDIASHSDIEEVTVSGDMAYCRTSLSVTIVSKLGKAPIERKGPTLTILRKGLDGQWRVTRDANMLA